MQALILKAPGALSNPISGTPILPDILRGILLEYNAEKLALADAASVVAWPNGNGSWGSAADLTIASASQPKFAANGVSQGRPSVKFTKSPATFLRTSSSVPANPKINTPVSVAVLIKFNQAPTAGAYHNLFSGRNGDAGNFVYARREDDGRLTMGAGRVGDIYSSSAVPAGSWAFLTFVFDGVNSKMFVDKVKTTGTCLAATWDGVTLGANGSEINNLDGDVAFMRAYSRALADSEVALLRETILSGRGLPV